MKNVLHVIESLEFGGAEKVVVQLANRFSETYNVTICITKRRGELCDAVNQKVKQVCLFGSEGNDFSVIGKLVAVIKENAVDVVHIHNWSVYIETVLAARIAGVKDVILTVHGPYIDYTNDNKSRLKKYIRHTIERFLSRYVSYFVPVSCAIKGYIESEIGINSSKIQVIHNGVKALNVKNRRIQPSTGSIKLVMIGRIAIIKNHKLMLDALNDLVGNNIDVFLTIAGDGPELECIKKYADDNHLNKYIDFLGFRNDIENILSDKDIFILTSNYEGISIALLESMSMGMPAIATRVGGVPETIVHEKTGLLIKAGDKEALVESIMCLSSNTELRVEMGTLAYDYFLKEFTEDKVIEQYNKLYNS